MMYAGGDKKIFYEKIRIKDSFYLLSMLSTKKAMPPNYDN